MPWSDWDEPTINLPDECSYRYIFFDEMLSEFFSGVATILKRYELIDMFHPKVTLLMHLNTQVCNLSIWSLNIGLPILVYLRRPLIYAVNGGTFNDSLLQRYVNNWMKMRMAVVASNEVLAMLLVLKNGLLSTYRLQQSIN